MSIRKSIIGLAAVAALVLPTAAMANNGGQTTTGPNPSNTNGASAYGLNRAGGGQFINASDGFVYNGMTFKNVGDLVSFRAQGGEPIYGTIPAGQSDWVAYDKAQNGIGDLPAQPK